MGRLCIFYSGHVTAHENAEVDVLQVNLARVPFFELLGMPPRYKTTGAERLRRTDSVSSTQTSSPGPRRTSSSVEPPATRQLAEVAAAAAYRRAWHTDHPFCSMENATRQMPERRRSHRTGRTEGSHFEEARLGRRRSTSARPGGRPNTLAIERERAMPPGIKPIVEHSGGERIVTRRRSVIPPNVSQSKAPLEHFTVPATSDRLRKSQSIYSSGSPTPRRTCDTEEKTSTFQLPISSLDSGDGYGGNLRHLTDFGEPTVQACKSPRPMIRETQTDEEILAMARDRCLLDFQQKKLKERKSFILAPFQKRRSTANLQKSSESSYDTSLPPFNYAGDTTLPTLSPSTEPAALSRIEAKAEEKKTRKFSASLKGRIMKAFGKPFRAPSGLPVQHVEAKHFHYAASEEAYHSLSEKSADPFVTSAAETSAATLQQKNATCSSRFSDAQNSDSKSRVTSWTNSTFAGTLTSHLGTDKLGPPVESGGLQRSGSLHSLQTLRKASSLLGISSRSRLRRSSKAELKGLKEDRQSDSALQAHVGNSERVDALRILHNDQASQARSDLERLPSWQDGRSNVCNRNLAAISTIRSVTPDPAAYRLGVPSPVVEVLSPDADTIRCPAQDHSNVETTPTPPPLHHSITKAIPPSSEQISRRMQKSTNRWQGPLDDSSPPVPRLTRVTAMDDNPYALPSLSQSLDPPAHGDYLPHHARVSQDVEGSAKNLLSPSIYSRATDSASPRPISPAKVGGMVVKITSREVRSYSISPPKAEQVIQRPVQTSDQWRRWISDEMSSFKAESDTLPLAGAVRKDSLQPPQPPSAQSSSVLSEPRKGSRTSSISPNPDARNTSLPAARPRASSKRSSFMNERYPMLDPSRNSSDQSVRDRKISGSRARDLSVGRESKEQRPKIDAHGRSATWNNTSHSTNALTSTKPVALAAKEGPKKERLATETKLFVNCQGNETPDTHAPTSVRPRATARHKSAFELRAKFKTRSNGRSTPLEIRRRPMQDAINDILEDNTIRRISAGPYASQVSIKQPERTWDDANKENTIPAESHTLPAVSSSEWLAAGWNKARRQSDLVRAHCQDHYMPSQSPARNAGYQRSGQGSPAQRMASEWMEKRSRETTPAFL